MAEAGMTPVLSPIKVSTSIVRALETYGEIPVDFLVKVVGRSSTEIMEYVDALKDEQVVEVNGNMIRLVTPTTR